MTEPRIILGDLNMGLQNSAVEATRERLERGRQYTDLSTVCVVPTRKDIPPKVVESWLNLMSPMNNKFLRMFMQGMEVGEAYERAIEFILGNDELKKWKFMLTLETDNLPPADGLLKLYENICHCKRLCRTHFAQVAGLYFTKGEAGQPMIYGHPKLGGFQPQVPIPDAVQECNGTGMGFTLYRLDLFKDRKIERPWFRTVQENGAQGTQDLFFMNKVRQQGYRIASDNRVRVGHWDDEAGISW